jgi:hypothetical protein
VFLCNADLVGSGTSGYDGSDLTMSDRETPDAERRASPRLDAADLVRGELTSVRMKVTVAEIGLGGFSVITDFPLDPGALYRFRFSRDLADEAPARVRARAVYCRKVSADGEPGRHVTGLAFVDERPRDRQAIGQLLDHVMSPLTLSAF